MSLFRYFFFIFLFLSIPFALFSNPEKIKPLEAQLHQTSLPHERFPILIELSEELKRSNPKHGLEYGQEAYEIAQTKGDKFWIAQSLSKISAIHCFMGNKSESHKYADLSLELARQHDFKELEADNHHTKGLTYFFMGLDEKAVQHNHIALEINEKLGRHEKAFQQLNNLSLVYRDIKRYDMALKFMERGEAHLEKMDDQKNYPIWMNFNKGYIYLHKKDYEKALSYVLKSQKPIEDSKDTVYIGICYNTIAVINNELGNYEESRKYANKALEYSKAVNMQESQIYSLHTLSEVEYHLKNYNKAILKATEALHLTDSLDTQRYTEGILKTLVSSYKAIGKIENALIYQDRLIDLKDSMYNKEKEKMIDNLDIAYITREKEEENQVLRDENEQIAQMVVLQRKYNWLSYGFGLLFLILSFTLYRSLNQRKENNKALELAIANRTQELLVKNKALETSNKELERFAHVASHDLKEPLRNISSFANLIQRRTQNNNDQDLKEYTDFIINGTKQMNNLVQSILSFSKLNENIEYEFEFIDMNTILQQIKSHLSLIINERNVQFKLSKLPQRIYGNADLIFLLVKNLIENGIKYNHKDPPIITIDSRETKNSFQIMIGDNGIGIEEKYFENIFGMFTRLHNRKQFQGSGMGLSICKKIVSQHKGKIWLESKPGIGSTFYFSIPKSKNESILLKNKKQAELIS